jgi:hypothetical protein
MYGAGSAERHPASELRSRHSEHVAQYPEERRVTVSVNVVRVSIYFDGKGHDALLIQNLATSTTAWAKACGASCGRLCPMPPAMFRCSYLPENFFA